MNREPLSFEMAKSNLGKSWKPGGAAGKPGGGAGADRVSALASVALALAPPAAAASSSIVGRIPGRLMQDRCLLAPGVRFERAALSCWF